MAFAPTLAGVLAGVAVALALLALSPPPRILGRPRPCAAAQLVDGRLRCDEELLRAPPSGCSSRAREAREAPALGPGDALEGCAIGRMPPDQLAALRQPVDLNRASLAELGSLPGVGPVLAGRIVAARPLTSVEALLEVRGIGPAKLAAARDRARVEAPEPGP